jgi:hypothetical protein
MTKKDYELIAESIKYGAAVGTNFEIAMKYLAVSLANDMERTHRYPNFNKDKFLKSCGF